MNCAGFEKLIALDAEGDLPAAKADSVADHLRTCSHCRTFAQELHTSQSLLKDLRQETVDEAALQAVRRGVLNRLPAEIPAAPWGLWRFALGAAMAAAIILAVVVFRHPSRAPGRDSARQQKELPSLEAEQQTPAPPSLPMRLPQRARAERPRHAHAAINRNSEAPRHPEPLTVKLLTNNPNVVIYWQVD